MIPTFTKDLFVLAPISLDLLNILQPVNEVDRLHLSQACVARDAFVRFCNMDVGHHTLSELKSVTARLDVWRCFWRSTLFPEDSEGRVTAPSSTIPVIFKWKDCVLDGRFDVYTSSCMVFEAAMSHVSAAIIKVQTAAVALQSGGLEPRDVGKLTANALVDMHEAKVVLKRWTDVIPRAQLPTVLLPGGLESCEAFIQAWRCIAFAQGAHSQQGYTTEAECYVSASVCVDVAKRVTASLPCTQWREGKWLSLVL